ncbi:hypothetical protein Tco_0538719 [Tanacetum coccineum]
MVSCTILCLTDTLDGLFMLADDISTPSLDLRHNLSSLLSPTPNQSIAGSGHMGRLFVQGFIHVTSVIEDDEESPATRSGLSSLYREAKRARKLLIISRIGNQKVLPWMVSPEGAIRCYDTVSLSQKLSLHRHAKAPISLHIFAWNQEWSR